MYEVRTTSEFDHWLDNLKNRTTILRISARIDRIQHGNNVLLANLQGHNNDTTNTEI